MINHTLDTLYNNRAAVPDHPAIFERWRAQSRAARARLTSELNLQYGADAKQTLDFFSAKQNRGLVIFIHGGYWRSLDKDDFSFIAEPYVAAGISVASINYRLCPAVSIGEILDDCSTAVAWLHQHVDSLGATFDRVVLVGHSAGAHLVAMLYAADFYATRLENESLRAKFCGGVAISGLYDLAPLLETSINADLQLDVQTANTYSPINTKPKVIAPLDVIVGADETSEFIRQSKLLPQFWPEQSPTCETIAMCNHFNIVDYFAKADSPSFQRALRFF